MAKASKKPRPTDGGDKRTPKAGNQRKAGDGTEPTKPLPPLREGNMKPLQQVGVDEYGIEEVYFPY